jgi:hypothetical protein
VELGYDIKSIGEFKLWDQWNYFNKNIYNYENVWGLQSTFGWVEDKHQCEEASSEWQKQWSMIEAKEE